MRVQAFAKVNLGLNVVGDLPNGYHELKMVMVPISIYDNIDIEFAENTKLTANRHYIPTDEKNSIIKVVNRMREKYGFGEHFHIHLNKYIPSQAGLGGGSADAAIMIRVINGLLKLRMSEQEMIDFGKTIGADVPFCLVNKPAIVGGIGEEIETFKMNCPFYLLLVKPSVGVSTKRAFDMLDYDNLQHPDVNEIRKALETNDYWGFISAMGNDLETTAVQIAPVIEKIKKQLIDYGFDGAMMSGSGSTVFGITRDKHLLEKAERDFRYKYDFVKIARIIDN